MMAAVRQISGWHCRRQTGALMLCCAVLCCVVLCGAMRCRGAEHQRWRT